MHPLGAAVVDVFGAGAAAIFGILHGAGTIAKAGTASRDESCCRRVIAD